MGLAHLQNDTHDAATYQADGNPGEEDHHDFVHDGHGVLADDGDDAIGKVHADEEQEKVNNQGGGNHQHDEKLSLGRAEPGVIGSGEGGDEKERGGKGRRGRR